MRTISASEGEKEKERQNYQYRAQWLISLILFSAFSTMIVMSLGEENNNNNNNDSGSIDHRDIYWWRRLSESRIAEGKTAALIFLFLLLASERSQPRMSISLSPPRRVIRTSGWVKICMYPSLARDFCFGISHASLVDRLEKSENAFLVPATRLMQIDVCDLAERISYCQSSLSSETGDRSPCGIDSRLVKSVIVGLMSESGTSSR